MTETNPLSNHFRMPGIHISLPSGGAFTDPKDLELSMTGELAISPMTARDEVWSKNPDSLLNGQSVEQIVRSCAPGIKNPRKMPAVDIDYVLLAIKKASYGNKITITAKCPKCGNEHDFECPIDEIMATAKPLPKEVSVRLNDDLVVNLRPHDYNASTKMNIAAFEETKLIQSMLNLDWTAEERVKIFSSTFNKISNLNLDMLVDSIISIVAPEAVVTEPKFIAEFIQNADRNHIKKIQEGMKQFEDAGIDKAISLVCPVEECQHEWSTDLIFDPSHFFA